MMMISIDDQTLTGDNLGRAKKGEKEASICASNHQVHTKLNASNQTITMYLKRDHIPCFLPV